MILLPVPLPEFNRKVKAAIRVGRDCSWRFYECLSELAFHADVICWEYVPVI